MMAASAAVFTAFGWHEVRKHRSGGDPLIMPGLFRKRAFLGGIATGTIYFAAFSGFGLVFNLHLQLGLGLSPLRAAVAERAEDWPACAARELPPFRGVPVVWRAFEGVRRLRQVVPDADHPAGEVGREGGSSYRLSSSAGSASRS
jgi:hypothetical protein